MFYNPLIISFLIKNTKEIIKLTIENYEKELLNIIRIDE